MTIYYANQAGTANGWTIGNDANDGLSEVTPKLTWNGAHLLSLSTGDKVYFNSSGSTQYTIPGGSSVLEITTTRGVATYNADGDYVFTSLTADVSEDEFIVTGTSSTGGMRIGF